MNRIRLWMVLFLGASVVFCYAQEKELPAQPVLEDALPDLSVLRNPFLSQMPVEIIQTIVEPDVQRVDNNTVVPPITPQIVEDIFVPPPQLRVQGVIWGTDRPQAIINNDVVRVGDIVQGCRISVINKNGVDVYFSGRTFNFKIEQ